jgi:hypothetical protein
VIEITEDGAPQRALTREHVIYVTDLRLLIGTNLGKHPMGAAEFLLPFEVQANPEGRKGT